MIKNNQIKENLQYDKKKRSIRLYKNEKSTITIASLYINIPRTTIEYWAKTEDNIRDAPKDKKRSTPKGPNLKFENLNKKFIIGLYLTEN